MESIKLATRPCHLVTVFGLSMRHIWYVIRIRWNRVIAIIAIRRAVATPAPHIRHHMEMFVGRRRQANKMIIENGRDRERERNSMAVAVAVALVFLSAAVDNIGQVRHSTARTMHK